MKYKVLTIINTNTGERLIMHRSSYGVMGYSCLYSYNIYTLITKDEFVRKFINMPISQTIAYITTDGVITKYIQNIKTFQRKILGGF